MANDNYNVIHQNSVISSFLKMFLFVIACRGIEAVIRDQGEIRLNNKEELKNFLFNSLKFYGDISSFAKRAQFANVKSIVYEFRSTNYVTTPTDPKKASRFFYLDARFIKSVKNSDGSYSVKHCRIVSSKEALYSPSSNRAYNFIRLDPQFPTTIELCIQYGPPRFTCPRENIQSLKGEQIQQVYDQLIGAINDKRANIIQWLQ